MRVDGIIFDLDGTLWNTSAACAIAWNNVTSKNAIAFRQITKEDIASIMGRPHRECVSTIFSELSEPEIDLIAAETKTEDNLMIKKHGGEIYDGVADGLKQLAANFPLYIVSNCQSGYIETFLKWSGYTHLFKDFECWGNTEKPKSENLQLLIERNNLNSTVYIGDTISDMSAAKDCSLPFIQVTYGFGNPIEGEDQVASFSELTHKLLPNLP